MTNKTQPQPKTKKLVVVRGKGTPREKRIETNVNLYWSEYLGRWVSVPEND